jgi:CrcB protein
MNLLAIALGGAAGSLLRFWLSTSIQGRIGSVFPMGTLAVNVLGCLMIGIVFAFLNQRYNSSEFVRAFLIIGLLGGFTTFSAFSMDTMILVNAGFWYRAMLNIILSVVVCLVAVVAGMSMGRHLNQIF